MVDQIPLPGSGVQRYAYRASAFDPTAFLLQGEVERIVDAASRQAYADALSHANSRTSKQVVAMLTALSKGVGPSGSFATMAVFQAAARDAQVSMLRSYDQTRRRGGSRGGGPAGYRVMANRPGNVRYAGGRMRAALAAKAFYKVTPTGVSWGNVALLNAAAVQWGRLNFGAQPAGTGSHMRFEVRWSNLVVATVGLDEEARPEFGMRGYWTPGGEFHPKTEGPVKAGTMKGSEVTWVNKPVTKGIKARNFIDAGLRRLVEGERGTKAGGLPDQLRSAYVRIYRNAEASAKLMEGGTYRAQPTRPPGFKVTRL